MIDFNDTTQSAERNRESERDEIRTELLARLKVTLDADTTRFDKAIADLDKALAEKEYLLKIQADLQEAEKKLQQYEQLLKEGKTLGWCSQVARGWPDRCWRPMPGPAARCAWNCPRGSRR